MPELARRYLSLVFIFAVISMCAKEGAAQQSIGQTLSTESVAERIGKPNWQIVDVRNSNAFNGWKIDGETQGGHIQGATNFALDWFRDTRAGLADLAISKGLAKSRLILYGSTDKEAQQMAGWLHVHAKVPQEKLFVYSDGFPAWSNDRLPVEKLARHKKLVPAWWVHNLARAKEQDYRIVEVGWKKIDQYKSGHVPGAVYLDTNEVEEAPLWNIASAEKIKRTLLSLGISKDTLVVVYGRDQTAATRAATIMMYAGVSDVRLLNGGYQAWLAAGYEVDRTLAKRSTVSEFGSEVPAHPEWIVGINEVNATLANPNGRLVSTRSWKEFLGETSGYAYIKRKGRINGAIWGRLDIDGQGMADFRNPDNTLRNLNEIEVQWNERNITRSNDICFYCGTGWRASEAFFAAYVMGFENISVFDGGWHEWSLDVNNQVETGTPNELREER